MSYGIIPIELILVVIVNCHQGGHHRGGGGHGWGQNHHHHPGRNPGVGWNNHNNAAYPNNFGNGGWYHQPGQIYSPNHFGQVTEAPISSITHCPRPSFTDEDAELVIEQCSDEDSSGHRSCWDSSQGIPIGWKVDMTCTKGKIRIKQPSTCTSSGEWTTSLPKNCLPLFNKYSQFQKIPLNNHQITTTFRTITTTPDSDVLQDDVVPTPYISNHEKQCPMLKMQLSENFIFSCFIHHRSSAETRGCVTTHPKVPSGSIAVLRCKPPFYNTEGNYSQWVCEDGYWIGDFGHKLKCVHSSVPIRIIPHTTPRTTTTTTTPGYHYRPTTTSRPEPHEYGWNIPSSTTTRYELPDSTSTQRTTTTSKFTTTTTTPRPTTTTRKASPIRPSRPQLDPELTVDETEYDYDDDYDIIKSTPRTVTTSSVTPSSTFTSPVKTDVCPPLKPRSEGLVLECVSKTKSTSTKSEQVFVNGCDIPQPVGAEAKYSCRQYYESTASLVSIYRKCKEDGTWSGNAEGFNCVPECGGKNEVFVPYITSGTPTFKSEWPWHAGLFQKQETGVKAKSGTSWEYICGGTLISKKTVLTAAHCVTFLESSITRNASIFRFDVGRYDLEKVDDIIQTKEVASIHTHPSYSPFGYDSDIAIVILKEAVGIGYHVRPVCFPQSVNTAQEELMLDDGSIGTVVGWGKTETGKISNQLHKAELRVVSQKECSTGTRGAGVGSLQIKSTTYCAFGVKNATDKTGEPTYVNVCSGDSGGGMYFPQTTSDSATTRWYLQGIVSVGIGDESNRCQPSQYSFFTRVGRYADWLIRVMSEHDAL